jgi:cell division control protein 45
MLIPINDIKHVYQHILQSALQCDGLGCTIQIFVSNDVDSIASLRIITSLLKSDEVQFVVIPVFSKMHIIAELRKLSDSKYLRSLMFINCGGDIDMSSQWFNESSEIKTYIMDCHRPYFHGNVNDQESKIFVIHDGCKSFEECPTNDDDRIYGELCEGESEEEDEGSDSDDFSDVEDAKKELNDLKDSDEEQDDAKPIEDENEDSQDKLKRKEADIIQKNRVLKRKMKIKFQKYYSGTFYGKSTSGIFY